MSLSLPADLDNHIDAHLERLVNGLERYIPDIRDRQLLFFDYKVVTRAESGVWQIKRSDLMPQRDFENFYDRLVKERRDWIHLAGDGRYGKQFLVSVEYSNRTGCRRIMLNTAGPVVTFDGKVPDQTRKEIAS